MSVRQRWLAGALVVVALAAAGCSEGDESDDSSGDAAATLEEVDGEEVARVTLAKGAGERLGLEMDEVSTQPDGTKAVPYAAVVYDADGATWVYTNPEGRTFVREPIEVTTISGDVALLASGPDAGTEVVTIGTAELYGVEKEIGA